MLIFLQKKKKKKKNYIKFFKYLGIIFFLQIPLNSYRYLNLPRNFFLKKKNGYFENFAGFNEKFERMVKIEKN
jgi:hypothetical protein